MNDFAPLESLWEATIDQGWDDTWHVSAGFQYWLNPNWQMTAGISYDTSPQTDGRRTPDLPVDRQIRYAVGASYSGRENFTVGGYLNYADLGDARIDKESYTGEYSSNSVLGVSFSFNWRFGG